MKDIFNSLLALVGIVIIILALTWIFTGNDFFLYKYFAPKQEVVRREVFEQTKSYNQGIIQELRNHQIEYLKASTNTQPAIASIILQQIADYPDGKLPADLKVFVQNLRAKQQGTSLENLR